MMMTDMTSGSRRFEFIKPSLQSRGRFGWVIFIVSFLSSLNSICAKGFLLALSQKEIAISSGAPDIFFISTSCLRVRGGGRRWLRSLARQILSLFLLFKCKWENLKRKRRFDDGEGRNFHVTTAARGHPEYWHKYVWFHLAFDEFVLRKFSFCIYEMMRKALSHRLRFVVCLQARQLMETRFAVDMHEFAISRLFIALFTHCASQMRSNPETMFD